MWGRFWSWIKESETRKVVSAGVFGLIVLIVLIVVRHYLSI